MGQLPQCPCIHMIGKRGGKISHLYRQNKGGGIRGSGRIRTFSMDQYFWRRKRQLRPLSHRPLYKTCEQKWAMSSRHLVVTGQISGESPTCNPQVQSALLSTGILRLVTLSKIQQWSKKEKYSRSQSKFVTRVVSGPDTYRWKQWTNHRCS